MKWLSCFHVFCGVLLFFVTPVSARVVTYPAPEGEVLSGDYILEVNGKPVDIYLARLTEPPDGNWKPGELGGPYSFAYFDFSGRVTVKVTSIKKPLDKLVIHPLSKSITSKIAGNTATFTITEPCKLSFEPEGRLEPLLIFANPPEKNPPKRDDPDVIYFGPGIHKPEKINVSSGQTLYIAGGAIVKGGVAVTGNNVKIMGRGILCGNDWYWRKGPGRLLGMNNAVNVSVEGIILRGSWSWTLPIYNCDSVTITNVKLCCGKNPNDDGINPCNSQHVTIRDCFIRTDDDCIAMKGINLGSSNDNTEYITVEDCIFWCDRAKVFKLGHESRAPFMRNIIMRNLDIIHFTQAPLFFEPGEEMSIENVQVENIRINAEYQPPASGGGRVMNYIHLIPVVNQYMRNKVPGKISNIHFKNVALTGAQEKGGYPIMIKGADPEHMVTDITFENVTWFGQVLNESSTQVRIEDNSGNIRFISE